MLFSREDRKISWKGVNINITQLIDSLEQDPIQGEPLGKDCYKVRVAIASKGKGKSGGGRVITCVKVVDQDVYLGSIKKIV